MMRELRHFTSDGLTRFRDFLNELKQDPSREIPRDLLEDPDLTRSVTGSGRLQIEERALHTRLEAGEYLNQVLGGLADPLSGPELWAWLTLLFFDSICPPEENGLRKPAAEARYIPDQSGFRRYRHALQGPFEIYRAFRDNRDAAMLLLWGPVSRQDEIWEQITSRPVLVQAKPLLEAATLLYFDRDRGIPLRGAASRGPGSVRRFGAIVMQLDRTWDLDSMDARRIIDLLPAEFDRYRRRLHDRFS
jgi:hypothetical protein